MHARAVFGSAFKLLWTSFNNLPIVLHIVDHSNGKGVAPILSCQSQHDIGPARMVNLLACIVGPGYWPLIAKTSLSVPSGAIVVFVIVNVYWR